MLVLVILLLFTCIQPLLPQQFEANLIIDHPITKRQMSNISRPRPTSWWRPRLERS